MATATERLSASLQALVDARLDTIDRMLLGRVPRQDRLAIARDVEAQVFDLLADRDPDQLDRHDVLAALARLDPPEAYLPDDLGEVAAPLRVPMRSPAAIGPKGGPSPRSAQVAGIVGICALSTFLLLPLTVTLTFVLESNFIFFSGLIGTFLLALVGGIIAIVLAVIARLSGPMAVVGLVTGILAPVLSLVGAAVCFFFM